MDGPTPEDVRILFRWLKEGPPGAIRVEDQGQQLGSLQAVTWEDAGDRLALERLARWQKSSWSRAPESFPIRSGTIRQWLTEEILSREDRLLFWVRDVHEDSAGYLGIQWLKEEKNRAILTDRLSDGRLGERLMERAAHTLGNWLRESLGLELEGRARARAA